jgi:hypothetical protein
VSRSLRSSDRRLGTNIKILITDFLRSSLSSRRDGQRPSRYPWSQQCVSPALGESDITVHVIRRDLGLLGSRIKGTARRVGKGEMRKMKRKRGRRTRYRRPAPPQVARVMILPSRRVCTMSLIKGESQRGFSLSENSKAKTSMLPKISGI